MHFEPLENRRLMSISLNGGVLALGGTSAGETIQVNEFSGTLFAFDGSSSQSFPASAVSSIAVDAGAGNDVVLIGSTVAARADVAGGDGDDLIQGGAGDDNLRGGLGSDTIRGGAGHDRIDGEGVVATIVRFGTATSFTGANRFGGVVLAPAPGNDNLFGEAGNDALAGDGGADTFSGGHGFDTADYSARTASVSVSLDNIVGDGEAGENDNVMDDVEHVFGGAGNDFLSGSQAGNYLAGGAGDDELSGFGGGDLLEGGDGADRVYGGDDNDTLRGGAGDDRLRGQHGDDTLDGGTGADRLDGGVGVNTADYSARTENLNLFLNDLPSIISVTSEGDILGSGSPAYSSFEGDVLWCIDNAIGGSGNDVITGNSFANRLTGMRGADLLIGGDGDDVLIGSGFGDGLFFGGSEAGAPAEITGDRDTLDGGGGNDVLLGGFGGDTINGGNGDDFMDGASGADTLSGGAGVDTADYSSRVAGVTVILDSSANDGEAGEGDLVADDTEIVRGGFGNDTIRGSTTNAASSANTFFGGPGNDRLDGGLGNDTLFGDGGNDTLIGGSGDDSLFGGSGDDFLNSNDGGNGNDFVDGGAGSDSAFVDRFLFWGDPNVNVETFVSAIVTVA
jgi:Ca2+-binding RTX toxin-like protein